jgi:5-methylcytosine-specific restriction endonuclease McrA
MSSANHSEGQRSLDFSAVPVVADKRCRKCKGVKPVDKFCKNRRMSDGLNPVCKACASARAKAGYGSNPEPQKNRSAQYRVNNRDKVLAYFVNGRRDEPERFREYERRHKEKHGDRIAARRRAAYWKDPVGFMAAQNAYREANLERFLITHRAACKKYDASHHAEKMERGRRRRARIRQATAVYISKADLRARVEALGNRCVYCAAPWEHIDHVKPIARGGPHCLSNLRPACRICNQSKSSMPHLLWLAKFPRPSPLPLP